MSYSDDASGSGGGFTPGAAKRIPFGNAGATTLTDAAELFYDSSTKRVDIGEKAVLTNANTGLAASMQVYNSATGQVGAMECYGSPNAATIGNVAKGGRVVLHDYGLSSGFIIGSTNATVKPIDFIAGSTNIGRWTGGGSFYVGVADIAADATTGHFKFPTCPTPPTGIPEGGEGSAVQCKSDHKLYVYQNSVWVAQT